MNLLGVVLAGGRSSRFGSDKALALYRGRSLLDHAIAALRPLVREIVLVGRAIGELRGLDDRPQSGLGPLGGINAGLWLARDEGFDGIVSVPCDVPLLVPATLALLVRTPSRAAVFADLPVCGYWPAALAPLLDDRLRIGGPRSATAWAQHCNAEIVAAQGFANVNTPLELAQLP